MTLNVGIAVHRYDPNDGTGGYVTELVPRIASEHRVTLYAAAIAHDIPAGVEVVSVPATMARAYTAILTFPGALGRVRRPHDILHAQGWTSRDADVVTAHIVLGAWRAASSRAGIRPPLGERSLGWYVERRERELIRRARHVIAPSEKVRRELAELYGRRHDVSVLHHAFPTPGMTPDRLASRQALGLPRDAFVALVAGDVRKTLRAAAAAAALAPRVHVAVASASQEPVARRWVAAAGIAGRFHWLGYVADMSQAYAAADVLLHPTIYDAFGLVVAEAMAHGLPVIVSREAGVNDLITPGESAWVLEDLRPQTIAAALSALAGDEPLRGALGRGARRAASRRTWDDVARETMAVYERVAAAR